LGEASQTCFVPEALRAELQSGNAEVRAFFGLYLPGICADLGLTSPELPHTEAAVLAALRRLAYHKGEDGSSIRWFAEYDASALALRYRHSRMLLADLVVIMQGCSPFNPALDFTDDLSAVFCKAGQSMQAACHVLRDESLFQAISRNQPPSPVKSKFPPAFFYATLPMLLVVCLMHFRV
jgi:hypothetical protein